MAFTSCLGRTRRISSLNASIWPEEKILQWKVHLLLKHIGIIEKLCKILPIQCLFRWQWLCRASQILCPFLKIIDIFIDTHFILYVCLIALNLNFSPNTNIFFWWNVCWTDVKKPFAVLFNLNDRKWQFNFVCCHWTIFKVTAFNWQHYNRSRNGIGENLIRLHFEIRLELILEKTRVQQIEK